MKRRTFVQGAAVALAAPALAVADEQTVVAELEAIWRECSRLPQPDIILTSMDCAEAFKQWAANTNLPKGK